MISVIAVNHNSSVLLKECLSSIVSTIGNRPFEFIAVDSGSRKEEVERLHDIEGSSVRIVLNKDNVGYARAVNIGTKNARGEFILITNPDVIYLPESLAAMVAALNELPRCGAVGPRTWWNRGMTFLLPSGESITPYWVLRTELMRTSLTVRNMALTNWIKRTVRYWQSEVPMKQDMLPGACIMTRKNVIEGVGGFDDAFPLYFEDNDWCRRMKKAGYRLYMTPRAHIVHYYNQSAKQDTGSSKEKFKESQGKYFSKHFKGQLPLFHMGLRLLQVREGVPGIYEDMGTSSSSPHFSFRDGAKKLLLLSPVDSLIPSAGSFVEGTSFHIPDDLWGLLGEGRYFMKALALDGFRGCGAWTFTKQDRRGPHG